MGKLQILNQELERYIFLQICEFIFMVLPTDRHDICQKNYATAVLAGKILRKKSVNRDIRQFATKERKCFKMA